MFTHFKTSSKPSKRRSKRRIESFFSHRATLRAVRGPQGIPGPVGQTGKRGKRGHRGSSGPSGPSGTSASHVPSELVISKYLMGTDKDDKAICLYNPSNWMIDLSQYQLRLYSNGSTKPSRRLDLDGMLKPHTGYLLVKEKAAKKLVDRADFVVHGGGLTILDFNGNDTVALARGSHLIVDQLGLIGQDPGKDGWDYGSSASSATFQALLVRKPEALLYSPKQRAEYTLNVTSFQPELEWDRYPSTELERMLD